MINWTDDQEKAISTVDKGVIVSAAAGSGKTAVLVERIIRLLSDKEKKIPADTLVAVTFTNDAAAQMREKIAAALEKRILENPSDEWLLTQQLKLPFAKISTINSFCYDLIKTYSDRFDIQSGVKIIDDNDLLTLKETALDRCFEMACEDNFEEFSFAYKSLCKKSDANLRDAVKRLSEFKRSVGFPNKWVELCRRYFKDNLMQPTIEEYKKRLKDLFIRESALIVEDMNRVLENIPGFIRFDDEKTLSLNVVACNSKEHIDSVNKIYEIYVDALEKVQLFDNPSSDVSLKFTVFKSSTYVKKLGEYGDYVNEFVKYRDKFKVCFTKCFSEYSLFFKSNTELDNKLSLRLFDAVNMLCDTYDSELWKLKYERNAIEFSDNEIMAVWLLAEETEDGFRPSEFARMLKEQGLYNIVLLDEYQDVNNLQDIIFKCISANGSDELVGTNEFVVGDIKQAIYKFRLTNPRIMLKARENARNENNKELVEEIVLKQNFRSRRNVVDFTNYIFSLLMSDMCGEVDYNNNERLQFAAKYNDREEDTEIIITEKVDDKIPAQYTACAKRIEQMLSEGTLVYDNGVDRRCRPSDFCIITRTNDACAYASKALERLSLKTTVETKEAYLKSREVSVLVNMLKVIDLPTNDISLVAVLLSDMFMFSNEEIAAMRLLNISGNMNFYMIMNNIAKPSERSSEAFVEVSESELGDKVRKALGIIKELRVLASCLSVDRLINKIFDYTDYFSVASTYENSLQKRANLRLLQNYAYTYENNVGGGLGGFIRYINSISDSKGDLAQAIVMNENSDAVNIKTIHKSKGLEYPFVFLCDLATAFKTENKLQMLIDEDMGVGFKIRDCDNREKITTDNYRMILHFGTMQSNSESMRLLYVALTRAREKLFICLEKDNYFERDINAAYELSKTYRNNRFDAMRVAECADFRQWMLSALIMHPDFRKQLSDEFEFLSSLPLTITEDMPKISINNMSILIDAVVAEKERNTEVDLAVYDELCNVMSLEYDNSHSLMTSKLSVTEIAKEDDSFATFYPQIPAFSDEVSKLTAAEKGTAVHAFMECCDFSLARLDVDNEINRLVKERKLTLAQADCIDRKILEGFFGSELFDRAMNSLGIEREKRFFVAISDLAVENEEIMRYNNTDGMLQGIADCVFEEDDGFVLIDYKTDRVTEEITLIERYTMQLRLYASAFNILLDKPVKQAYIYSFALKKIIPIKI